MTLLIIICFVWLFFVIVTNSDSKTKKGNINKFNHVNDKETTEGIIYPIHIKYKKAERTELPPNNRFFNYDKTYFDYISNSPSYKCIIDNEVVTALSIGQETELDVALGEHVIFFEASVLRNKV